MTTTPAHDVAPCVTAGEHTPTARHARDDCPTTPVPETIDGTGRLLVTNNAGRPFAVRYVVTGDRYGANDCLTHEKPEPLVEFYDLTHTGPDKFGPRGQFVSRYFVPTILGTDGYGTGTGAVCLDGGNAHVWAIDADTMGTVRGWLAARHAVEVGA